MKYAISWIKENWFIDLVTATPYWVYLCCSQEQNDLFAKTKVSGINILTAP